jgi:hypothetical protein
MLGINSACFAKKVPFKGQRRPLVQPRTMLLQGIKITGFKELQARTLAHQS